MSYADRLKKLQGAWKSAKPATGGGSLPAGKYQMQIARALITEGKAEFNKGHMQVELQMTVVTGKMKGRKMRKWIDLEAPANEEKNIPSGMAQFKGILEVLSLDMPDLDKLEKFLNKLVGCVINTQVVVNQKGYANVYINSLVNAASDSEDEDEDEDEDEEESTDDDEDEDDEDEDEDEEEEAPAPVVEKRGPGRPPGSKNKPKVDFPAKKPEEEKKPKKPDDDEDFDDWEDDDE